MIDRATWKRWLTHPVVDWTIFVLGVVLILLAPVVGALPGPGGVFVLALGLAMVLRTSRWARRRYVEFKRWQPKAGRWTDWGMRRKSALRREAKVKEIKLKQQRKMAGVPEGAAAIRERLTEHAVPPPQDQVTLTESTEPKTAAQLAKEMDLRLRDSPGN